MSGEPARTGNPRAPGAVREALRRCLRGTDLAWLSTHTFRRTAATTVKQTDGLEAASLLLGHADSRTTSRHYVQRLNLAPDVSSTLAQLGGKAS